MNVCYLITTLAPAGAENLLLDIVRHTPPEDDISYTVCFMGRDDTLEREFEDAGARVVDFNAEILFPYDPRALSRMYRFFRREPIDILHAHLPSMHWIGRSIGRLAGISCIVSTHHNLPDNYGDFSRATERLTRPLDSVTVAVSEGVREAFGGTEDGWRVIHNGIEVDRFAETVAEIDPTGVARKFDFDRDALVFLNVARYSPQKAQVDLVRAMERVAPEVPGAALLLVGWGDCEEEIGREIRRRNLEDRVFLTGRVGTVHEYYALADVFVLPSRIEGFGIVLLEAMAAGLPAIATDIPGVNEVVRDGDSGILVRPADPDGLAEAMISMRSAGHRKRFGSRGRERVARHFDVRNTVESHRDLYRNIAK